MTAIFSGTGPGYWIGTDDPHMECWTYAEGGRIVGFVAGMSKDRKWLIYTDNFKKWKSGEDLTSGDFTRVLANVAKFFSRDGSPIEFSYESGLTMEDFIKEYQSKGWKRVWSLKHDPIVLRKEGAATLVFRKRQV
jgi:hypothetical protein